MIQALQSMMPISAYSIKGLYESVYER